MPLGMNTNAIFNPRFKFGQEMYEASYQGLSRIEISYYADSVEAETDYFKCNFSIKASQDIDKVLQVLNTIGGLYH